MPPMIPLSTDLPQRVQDKIRKRENGCWEWQGGRNKDGYGRVQIDGRPRLAHRVIYEQLAGPIPKESLDHLCRNRRCCRPSHLAPATNRENLMAPGSQALAKLCADKTCCPKCGGAYSYTKNGWRTCRPCEAARKAASRDHINAVRRARHAAKRGLA